MTIFVKHKQHIVHYLPAFKSCLFIQKNKIKQVRQRCMYRLQNIHVTFALKTYEQKNYFRPGSVQSEIIGTSLTFNLVILEVWQRKTKDLYN